ncbi:MAG: hypothetical protein IK057_02185 [Clostridia bacterium]|nr:hypothetical protein [Clostridia bacterium]
METLVKASVNAKLRRNATIKISIVGTVAILGLVLSIYSLVTANLLFSLWYFVAFVLGLSYVVIRINAIFPTYVSIENGELVMSIWENGIVPYKLPEKPTFLSDFMPDKIKKDKILIEEIAEIYLGSKRFFDRNVEDAKYPDILKRIGENTHFESTIKRMDFMLVIAKDGESCFMSVTDFDVYALAELLDEVEKSCADIKINIGIPKLKRIRERMKKA